MDKLPKLRVGDIVYSHLIGTKKSSLFVIVEIKRNVFKALYINNNEPISFAWGSWWHERCKVVGKKELALILYG